jgi:hypothetical protein
VCSCYPFVFIAKSNPTIHPPSSSYKYRTRNPPLHITFILLLPLIPTSILCTQSHIHPRPRIPIRPRELILPRSMDDAHEAWRDFDFHSYSTTTYGIRGRGRDGPGVVVFWRGRPDQFHGEYSSITSSDHFERFSRGFGRCFTGIGVRSY